MSERSPEDWGRLVLMAIAVRTWPHDPVTSSQNQDPSLSRLLVLKPQEPTLSFDEFRSRVHAYDRRLVREELGAAGREVRRINFEVSFVWPDGLILRVGRSVE